MSIHVTPDILESVYELLRQTPPFRGWKLPHPDDIGFVVSRSDEPQADYYFEKGRHHIRVSHKRHSTLYSVIQTVAHEMCHMRDQLKGVKSHHGRSFQRMADAVCRQHGFDRGQF